MAGSEANRVLYFEIVAGVHLFQQATESAKNHYKALVENVKTLQADLNENVKTRLAELSSAYETKTQAINDKLEYLYSTWDEDAQKSVDKQIAQIEKWKKAQITAIEEVRNKAITQAGNTGIFNAQGGQVANTAAIAAANALYQQQMADLQALVDLKMKDAQAAITGSAEQITALQALVEQLRRVEEQYALLAAETETSMRSGASQGIEKAGAAMGALYNGAMTAIPAIGAVGLVLAGVYTVLDKVTMSAAAYAMKIVQLGAVTGLTDKELNNTYHTLQVYNDLFQYFGLQQEQVNMAFTRFSRTLEAGGNNLAQYGIHATNMNDLLVQLSDRITKTTNDTEKQNIVLAALGVTGGNVGGSIAGMAEQITAALNIGNPAIKAYGENMTALGLIMNDDQLKAGAAADAIHGQMTLAFQGLERQVGESLFPTMDALWLMISAGAKNSAGAISTIADTVAKVFGIVVGFIAGLFGVSQADMKNMLDGAKAGIKAAAGAAADNANAQRDSANAVQSVNTQVKNLTEANKDLQQAQTDRDRAAQLAQQNLEKAIRGQTQAIENQIKSLQDNKQNYDQMLDDQVRAAENAKTNYEDQLRLSDDLHQSVLTQLQDQLDLAQDVDERKMRSNETLVDYQRRMYENNLKDGIKAEENKRKTTADTMQQQIDQLKQTVEAAKEAYGKQTDAQIDALNAQKQALENYLTDKKNAMQNELDAERNATNRQVQANESKIEELRAVTNQNFDSMSSSAGVNALDIEHVMDTAFSAIQSSSAMAALNVGNNFHNSIANFFSDPGGTLGKAANDFGGYLASNLANGLSDWLFGSTKGNSWWQTTIQDLTGGFIQFDHGPDVSHGGSPFGKGANPLVLNADGGIYTKPTLTMSSEFYQPEAIIPLDKPGRALDLMNKAGLTQLAGAAHGGGGSTTTVNFNGPVADALVGARVADNIVQAQKKNQLRYGAGL